MGAQIQVHSLVSYLTDVLNFTCVGSSQDDPEISSFLLDLSKQRFNRFESLPFLVVSRKLADEGFERVVGVLMDRIFTLKAQGSVTVVVLPVEMTGLNEAMRAFGLDVAVFQPKDVDSVIQGTFADFLGILSPQVRILSLSPYQTSGPVTGSRFFGRGAEIDTIISQPKRSFAVLGVRKIGKTSLLMEIQRKLENVNHPVEYLDCSGSGSADQIVGQLVMKIEARGIARISAPSYQETLSEMLRLHEKAFGGLTLLLDEVDSLVSLDQGGWTVTQPLLSAAMQGFCRVVASGHVNLRREMAREQSPFFNFFEPVTLGRLTKADVRSLVVDPLEGLGVKFQSSEEIVNQIFLETGGHPNLVQYLCQLCVQKMDQEGGHRMICPDCIDAARSNTEFRSFVLSTFDSDTGDLGKSIVFAFSRKPPDTRFDEQDVARALGENGILVDGLAVIPAALSELVSTGFVIKAGRKYQISNRVLLNASTSLDVDELLSQVRHRIIGRRA